LEKLPLFCRNAKRFRQNYRVGPLHNLVFALEQIQQLLYAWPKSSSFAIPSATTDHHQLSDHGILQH
jgi:hypothetical protein